MDITMSHISGVCEVMPIGRTQPEKTYTLETVLSHLPAVCGNEDVMHTMVNILPYCDNLGHRDEFFNKSNLARTLPFYNPEFENCFSNRDVYAVTLNAKLNGVDFNSALKMFMKWIMRFKRRIFINTALVKISNIQEEKNFVFDTFKYKLYHIGDDFWEIENWSSYLRWEFDIDENGNKIFRKPYSHYTF